jgi:membrane-bound serine protease (ClpP class)
MDISFLSLFQHPICNIIFIVAMIGGLVIELQVPGKIIPLLISLVASVAYFVPYYMLGTVETWELFVYILGFILLLLEIFVIPGFGLTGISGFIAVFASLALVTLKNHYLDFSEVSEYQIFRAVATTMAGAVCSILFLGVMAYFVTNTNMIFNRVALQSTLSKENGYHIENQGLKNLIGQKGVVYHKLRPVGKIMVNHAIYEATTQNKFLEQGHIVEVLEVKGNMLIVS